MRTRLYIIILVPFRFAILSDAGTDAVLGHQTHDIRSRELGDARFAALGGSRRRRSGSVRNAHFSLVFLLFFVSENSINQLNTFSAMEQATRRRQDSQSSNGLT
jgi:hypothetical protein